MMKRWKDKIEWRQFVMGVVCLAFGVWNLQYHTWFNVGAAAAALVAGGFSLSGSWLYPVLRDYGDKFDALNSSAKELRERYQRLDPKAAAKEAAEVFKAEILERYARGEFGPNIQIVIGDEPLEEERPPGRLN
jgi:hypothetical protein